MKNAFLLVIALSLGLACPGRALADINEADLKKEVRLTEKAALLSQIDAVSLYMTSSRVVFAPHLTGDNVIEVETTVLAPDLTGDGYRMKNLVTRQIDTFVSVLRERLPVYAPSVAESFDQKNDIRFIVNATSRRIPVATWDGRGWKWDGSWNPQMVPVASRVAGRPTGAAKPKKGKLGCNCPARR